MKNKSNSRLNRRGFLTISATALLTANSAAIAGTKGVGLLLKETDVESVSRVIKKAYGKEASKWTGLETFLTSLQADSLRCPEFKKSFGKRKGEEALERYIVEEFAVRTNYLEWSSNQNEKLTLIS